MPAPSATSNVSPPPPQSRNCLRYRLTGVDLTHFIAEKYVYEMEKKGAVRTKLLFNPEIGKSMGIKGWHCRVLRSSAFRLMLDQVPKGIIHTGLEFDLYTERAEDVEVPFKNAVKVTADIVFGADGSDPECLNKLLEIRSFSTPVSGSGSLDYLVSFFPMLHDGKPGFEWWVVEPSWEGKLVPTDVKAHLSNILKDWADPMPRFPNATDFDTQVYRWEIYNRPSLEKWSKGRMVAVGDAVHPVSPYAAYDMGMAIENGYFLARALEGVDLRDLDAVQAGFGCYEKERVDYVNRNMEFARFLGRLFHSLPSPLAWLRDTVFDKTAFLGKYLTKGYLEKAEKEAKDLKELHVKKTL